MKKFKILALLVVVFLLLPCTVFAHSGRTDANGGHKDNKNKSGLGSYHYHCGGHEAHLHPNGVCPYGGGGSSGAATPEPVPTVAPKPKYPESVTIVSVPDQIYASEAAELSCDISEANDQSITWTSSDPSIAKIEGGKLIGISPGQATIVAKSKGTAQDSFVVNILPIESTAIQINEASGEFEAGQTQQLTTTLEPANTTDKSITWTSSDEKIAQVDANGKVSFLGAGNVIITAQNGQVTSNVEFKVKKIDVKSIEILYDEGLLSFGKLRLDQELPLECKITPDNASIKTVKWETSDPNVAKMIGNRVIPENEGDVTIIATVDGISQSFDLKVGNTNVVLPIAGAVIVGGGITGYIKRDKIKEYIDRKKAS